MTSSYSTPIPAADQGGAYGGLMAKLDLNAARSIFNVNTSFKQFAIAAGANWPVKATDDAYKTLADAYSAAKKAAVQNGPATINEPLPKEKKAAKAKGAKMSFKPKAGAKPATTNKKDKPAKAAKAAADDVTITAEEREAIEAEVRAKTVRPCGCGCGVETRASFLPGHDAKLRSALIAKLKANKASEARKEAKRS